MAIVAPRKTQNYLNNKDLLIEIHNSKLSYCWVLDPAFTQYDIILHQPATILRPDQTEMETRFSKKKGRKELVEEFVWPTPEKDLIITRPTIDDVINNYTIRHLGSKNPKTGVVTPGWIEKRDAIQDAKENRAARLSKALYDNAVGEHDLKDYRNKPKQKEFVIDPDSIDVADLVFRVHTFTHIPDDLRRKPKPKKEADFYKRLNFPPFKHYAFVNGKITEVVRSHWKGDLATGRMSKRGGRLTPNLGMMFLKLAERYSHRSNWRNYTYVDEMRGNSLLQLTNIGLQFDESKSDNPFAYYTTSVKNGFTRVLNTEKKNQDMRDDILIQHGHLPSYGRQLDHESDMKSLRDSHDHDDE